MDGGSQPYTARLLISCPDRPGIVAAVSGFLFAQGANIVSSHQYSSDPVGGRFFMRTELFLDDLAFAGGPAGEAAADTGPRDAEAPVAGPRAPVAGPRDAEAPNAEAPDAGAERDRAVLARRTSFQERFAEVADRFDMDWEIRWWGQRRRIAILVSRRDHCLVDLLYRWRRGELDGEVVAVISNHEDLRRETESAGAPFHYVPVPAGEKPGAEAQMLDLLGRDPVELLVLARYMLILSGDFLARAGAPAINIHHSFLPAFAGAEPYRRARERGVKLIGATAHYVTAELDDGPIIDQDVVRVDHRHTVADLERIGRDVERLVLARAVALHLDDRVIVDGRRTVVF